MKKYVVYYQDYDFTSIHVICDTEENAQEYLLSLIEDLNYEDYFQNYVNAYTDHSDPFYDYWYGIKQDTEIRNSMTFTYQKHDWTPAGWELFSMAKGYIIVEADVYE